MVTRSPSQHDAIVIGTGLGGSSAAALLAHQGLRVLILEKNPRIGGSCSFYKKKGVQVDIGTHLFSRGPKGPIGEIQNRLGLRKKIRFRQLPDMVLIRGFGIDLTLPRAYHRFPLQAIRAEMQAHISPLALPSIARFFADVVFMKPHEVDALNDVPMLDFIFRYTKDPVLVASFGFLLGLYFVLPLEQVSAGEGVWCFQRMVRNNALSYPLGGAVTIPETFVAAARTAGAVLRTRCGVSRIEIDRDNAVRGVETTDGRYYTAPIIVSSSSMRTTILSLCGSHHFPESYVDRVSSLVGSAIAVQAKICLDRPVLKAGCMIGGHSDEINIRTMKIRNIIEMFEQVSTGSITHTTPVYAPIPTNFDASLAPGGEQLITACAVAPTSDVHLKDKPELWVDNMMHTIKQMAPEIVPHIQWIDTMKVKFIENWIGKQFGPAISTGQTPDQVGWRRPPVRTPVRGLYICGDGAGGRGIGTELATASAIECADAVLQDRYNGLLGTLPSRLPYRRPAP